MSNDGKSTGNLFVNDYKKTAKQPDFTGYLEVTKEQIDKLIIQGKAGKDVKLKLGCWKYPSKRDPNEIRLFLVAECDDYEKKEPEQSTDGWENTPF